MSHAGKRRYLRENICGAESRYCSFVYSFGEDSAKFYFEVNEREIISPFTCDNEDIWQGDVVEVFISPDGDLSKYYELEVSPFGVRFWGLIVNRDGHTPEITKRPPVFSAIAKRSSRGYSVEIVLPYSSITGVDKQKIRFNAFCINTQKDGTQLLYALMPTLCDNFHRPSFFIHHDEEVSD